MKFQITSQSRNQIAEIRSFEFPEVEDVSNFWYLKTLQPNYGKRTPAELTVEYNETEAA